VKKLGRIRLLLIFKLVLEEVAQFFENANSYKNVVRSNSFSFQIMDVKRKFGILRSLVQIVMISEI
jgi:hypothetical protein